MNKKVMNYLRKERYGYFLIWGNGIQYKEEILDILRSKEFIKILRIMNHRPKSIAHLVKTIYSYDYAPFEHLKAKTRYLLKTDPDVVFIFFRNEDAQERYFGGGAFRHIECERIKSLKEEIRDKFNPRIDGKRTEEHVVHASDNESQTDHILKYLRYKNGVGHLKNVPNPILSAPYYIPGFGEFTIRRINSSQLYCNILRGTIESYWTEPVQIEDTPQFTCLTGDTQSYNDYLARFTGGPLTCDYSVDNLMELSQNFAYLEPPYAASYILVNEFPPNKYLILDGVHRATILKFRGITDFPVAVTK
jgi:hypothetical protein